MVKGPRHHGGRGADSLPPLPARRLAAAGSRARSGGAGQGPRASARHALLLYSTLLYSMLLYYSALLCHIILHSNAPGMSARSSAPWSWARRTTRSSRSTSVPPVPPCQLPGQKAKLRPEGHVAAGPQRRLATTGEGANR